MLNAGHRRGAVAGRCVVKGNIIETEEFPAYCAVALAGLGGLPDTIISRSVVIRMRRRGPAEPVEPFRRRAHVHDGHELRDKLEIWARDYAPSAIGVWPEMPVGIKDRDADVWEALLAVADLAGGGWPHRARVSAVALVAASKGSTPSLGVKLLSDLRDVLGDCGQLPTQLILEALHQLDELPWGDLRGKPLDARGLSQRLRPYDIKPTTIRTANGTPKGYRRTDMIDAWSRYLDPPLQETTTTATSANVPSEARSPIRCQGYDMGDIALTQGLATEIEECSSPAEVRAALAEQLVRSDR